jgi:hypothetical protein
LWDRFPFLDQHLLQLTDRRGRHSRYDMLRDRS